MTEQPFANLVQVLHLLKNILPGRFLVDCHELDKLRSLKNTLSAFIFLSWLQDISVEGSSTHPSPCKEESAEWKREKQELKHQRVENNQRQNGNDQIIIYRRWRNWNNGVVASLSAQEPRSVAEHQAGLNQINNPGTSEPQTARPDGWVSTSKAGNYKPLWSVKLPKSKSRVVICLVINHANNRDSMLRRPKRSNLGNFYLIFFNPGQ